ncbi:unnamed protein product [Orchesella dallaii]|uniref:Gustatory receptor n=1 Tax=Orchesella dallaii TaxID=48710 RepID=A0ABP1RTA4_9HEXA
MNSFFGLFNSIDDNGGKPWCPAAFNIYHKLTKYCIPIILEWDPEKERVFTRGAACSKYLLWYFNMFVVVFSIGFFSCFYTAASYKSVPPYASAIGTMYGLFSVITWASSMVILSDPHEFVSALNSLADLRQRLEIRFRSNIQDRNVHLHNNWKWIARIQAFINVMTAIISVATPFVFICMSVPLDPFYVTFPWLVPISSTCLSSSLCKFTYDFTIWVVRFVVSLITTTVTRCFAMLSTTFTYMFEIKSRCLDTFQRLSFGIEMDLKMLKWYQALQIANVGFKNQYSWIFAICMGDGFVTCVVCNVVSIKRFDLPIAVYWLAPAVSVMCGFFMFVFLPVAIESGVKSQKFIRDRSNHIPLNNDGVYHKTLVRRRLKALRPVPFYCGSIMPFEFGMDRMFFVGVFLRTIDAFLLMS